MAINKTIDEQGGLQAYLDSDYQRKRHGGRGYAEFLDWYMSYKRYGADKKKFLTEWGIGSLNTLNNWIKLQEKQDAISPEINHTDHTAETS